MTTLSLTLPISCQICLGKVKDPVICPNNHAFCTVCLDVWLQTNGCCPTCRVDITKDRPYRKVIGSDENNETLSLQRRMELRKTRLELLGKEYEAEIQSLDHQLNRMTQENEKLKKEVKDNEQESSATEERSLLSSNTCNVEALSSLTKKLQEISTTYDDVRRDMSQLQQEKEKLQRENNDLKSEILKLKEDSMFTKSPKRYEKFTITGLKARVEQYEKENQQLKKALQNSDKYVEQLQMELRKLKTGSEKNQARIAAKHDNEVHDVTKKNNQEEGTFSHGEVARQPSIELQVEASVGSITPLSESEQHERCPSPMNNDTTLTLAQSGECSRDLFPATKKLLALKKIHETNVSPPPPPQNENVYHVSPVAAINLPWSSAVSCINYKPPNEAGGEVYSSKTALSQQSSGTFTQQSSETFSCSVAQESSQCSGNASSNVILTAAGILSVPSTSSPAEPANFDRSPKRNTPTEPCFLNKKIKIEKD